MDKLNLEIKPSSKNDLESFRFLKHIDINNFYDIGVGLKTEYIEIKKFNKNINLFGIEPNPYTYNYIKDKFDGKLLNKAISYDDNKDIELYINKNNLGNSSLIFKQNQSIKVSALSLDNFDKENLNPDKIFLWMDIEGYELSALKTGHQLLNSKRVKMINLECRNYYQGAKINDFVEICSFLKSKNYYHNFSYNFHFDKSSYVTHWDSIFFLKAEN